MTPARFQKLYPGKVVRAQPSAVEELSLPKRSRDFLVEAGLPASLPDLFQLTDLKRRKFLRMDRWPEIPDKPPVFADLCVIARVEGRPICINSHYGTVSTLRPDGRRFELMNTDISHLAVCMVLFEQAQRQQPPAWDECLRAIEQWDGNATARDGFWKRLLARLIDEQAASAAPDDPVRRLRIEHPRLGLLRWDERGGAWCGEFKPLRQLSQFGWNLHRYRKAASPPRDPKGNLLPGAPPVRFLPRPSRQDNARGAIKIEIQADDKTPPTARQERAISFLIDNEDRIRERIVRAIRRSVPRHGDDVKWMADELGNHFQKLDPLLDCDDGWGSLVEITEITVSKIARGSTAMVGYQANCAWDQEHGLGFQMLKDRITEFGQSDTGWMFF